MSDLDKLDAKVQEGIEWRGEINVNVYGEEYELTIRQLRGPEFDIVMDMIDRTEIREMREAIPDETQDRLEELQGQDELTEDEQEELDELRQEMIEADTDPFQALSPETLDGLRQCAKYAVEPDEQDLAEAFTERAPEIEAEYGIKVSTPDDLLEPLRDEIKDMIEKMPREGSIVVGLQCLMETVGKEEGKLES